jgi:Domain of unknown function (DUF4375)
VQPLVNEVILFSRPSSGGAAGLRRMGVPSPAAELMTIQSKIDEVTGFAYDLSRRHVRDDEIPPKVINVSRVNFFVGEVLNGGFLQFVHNSKWDRSFVAGVRGGLAAIGAREHLAVFEGAARVIEEAYAASGGKLDTSKFKATVTQLERKHFSNLKLTWRTGWIVGNSWTWGERWQSAQILSARYIDEWQDVQHLPRADYEAALDRIAARIPDLAARRQKSEDARPWEKNVIDRLVAEAFLSDIWYTSFSTREYNGRNVWCWNFTVGKTPGQGHHQAIFVEGNAIMFKGSTDQIVAQRPAPQAIPGSGFISNEPETEPGTKHSNIILIANP